MWWYGHRDTGLCDYAAKRLLTRPGLRCAVEVQMSGLQVVLFLLAVNDSGIAGGT